MARSTLNGLGQGLDGDKTTTGATCISSLPNMSQEDRGVLRLGDKTTRCPRCGEMGVIAEGSQIFKWYDIPTALDGARIQCGCPVGSNRLIAIAGSPPAGTAPAASPRSATTPSSAQPAAQPATAAPSASPSSWTGTSARPSTEDNQPVEPGFYIVPKSITRRALEAELFGDAASPDVMRKFHGLNGSLGDDIVKAGQLVVLSDPRNNMCMREEAHLMQAAEETADALRELAPEEADLMVKHQAAIAAVLGEVSTWVGVTTAVLEKHMKDLTRILIDLEKLHQETYRVHGHLRGADFFERRKKLLDELDTSFFKSNKLRSVTSLGSHPKLKKALGISTKSLVHHWNKAGGPGPIPGYSNYVNAVAKVEKYMKVGGAVAIGIGGVSSVLAIKDVCMAGTEDACRKKILTEGGKFSGATVGGVAGAKLGVKYSPAICVSRSSSPSARGILVCSLVVVGGAS